ncbi:MAG: proprotein convertase P-domain-containing protein [Croceitalea sp.]|nr:proprotein convertase P-domain-containing protein [Croceitalea sp.]
MRAKLHFVLSISIFFSWFYGFSQIDYWKSRSASSMASALPSGRVAPVFELRQDLFERALNIVGDDGQQQIYLPNESGNLEGFAVLETPVLRPKLAAKYRAVKSYTGWSDSGLRKVRFSYSSKGLQVMLIDRRKGKTFFIEQIGSQADTYGIKDNRSETREFICKTQALAEKFQNRPSVLIDDQTLRKFRIAVSATGEYTTYHGGTVEDALAAINATLTRVNEVFESDLGVVLELIGNNDQVIFVSAGADPYGNNLNAEVQSTLTSTIGESNYDVGHLFHRDNDNGNAGFIGSVCSDNRKGSAFSSAMEPEGDDFDLDYVAHELGHQFGANHTWSFESENTGVQAEPGSGTTIMGYAGIVDGSNVAPDGDEYFHYNSILQIGNYLQTIACAQTSPLTNTPPVVAPLNDQIIPKGTPFLLTANAFDPDLDDVLTYTWEQIDDGVVTAANFGPDNASGANFRSLLPTTSPTRFFPKLSRVVSGQLTQVNPVLNSAWETVSNVERELNFAITVRDNAIGGGQVASEIVKVQVTNSAGPFVVNSQNGNETYIGGSVQEISWDVANTNRAPINATQVDVYFSLDGGATFPLLIAEGIINNGTANVQLPGIATSTGRIMIRAANNIFFAMNGANITIEESPFLLSFDQLIYDICQPNDVTIPFEYETNGDFAEEVTFAATLPAGLTAVFTPPNVNGSSSPVNMDINGISTLDTGNYPISVTATSASETRTIPLEINVYDGNFEAVTLEEPLDNATNTALKPELRWMMNPNFTMYQVQIATDVDFTTIVEDVMVAFNTYEPTNLMAETTYYWRVKPSNECGEGTFGLPFSFTTSIIDCGLFDTDQQPLEISANGMPTLTSVISVAQDFVLFDVNVILEISHTYLEDLVISLISPSGTTVVLTSKNCGSLNNLNATFDDAGSPIACSGNPAISGVLQPVGSLAAFNGESILGEWTLQIEDTASSDGGSLDAFSLEFCVEGILRPDDDNDGVFDDGDDLCLGTPKGQQVDTSGCPVYSLAQDNFNISIQSETCASNNDGSIEILASDNTIDYEATLTGNGIDQTFNFIDQQIFNNLTAGDYRLCLSGTKGTIDYRDTCFDINITEPEPLQVGTTLLATTQQLRIDLNGGMLYNIELDGILTQTTENEIIIDLKDGQNTLKVYTNLSCQGVYSEQLYVSQIPVVFPNPVNDLAFVRTNRGTGIVNYDIYAANGQLVAKGERSIEGNEIAINMAVLPTGLYYLVLKTNSNKSTIKLVKK